MLLILDNIYILMPTYVTSYVFCIRHGFHIWFGCLYTLPTAYTTLLRFMRMICLVWAPDAYMFNLHCSFLPCSSSLFIMIPFFYACLCFYWLWCFMPLVSLVCLILLVLNKTRSLTYGYMISEPIGFVLNGKDSKDMVLLTTPRNFPIHRSEQIGKSSCISY